MFEEIRKKQKEFSYPINEIFASIQGEGKNLGQKAHFIRLSGCNLKCEWCDTKHQTFDLYTVNEIMSQISLEKANLVVITSGEPLMWDLSALLNELISNGFSVALETNGTLTLKKLNLNFLEYDKTHFEVIRPRIHIACSPKPPEYFIHPKLPVDELKFVVADFLTEKIIQRFYGVKCFHIHLFGYSHNLNKLKNLLKKPFKFKVIFLIEEFVLEFNYIKYLKFNKKEFII
jgi:organic radical activating enzyme